MFVPKGAINNNPALVQIMAWCRPGNKPLSEPIINILLTHICVTRPQWVKMMISKYTEEDVILFVCHNSNWDTLWFQFQAPSMGSCGMSLFMLHVYNGTFDLHRNNFRAPLCFFYFLGTFSGPLPDPVLIYYYQGPNYKFSGSIKIEMF